VLVPALLCLIGKERRAKGPVGDLELPKVEAGTVEVAERI